MLDVVIGTGRANTGLGVLFIKRQIVLGQRSTCSFVHGCVN